MNERMRGLVSGILLLMAASCGSRSAPDPILIGHVAPLTGADKDIGEHARKGIELAVAEANEQEGLILGRKVAVEHADTHSDVGSVRGAATRLVTLSRAVALLGGNELARVDALDALTQTNKVPAVLSAQPPVRPAGSFLFYTGLPPGQKGQVLARFATSEWKGLTAGVLYHADATATADAFARDYPADKLVGRWSYPSADKLTDATAELRNKAPGLVLFAGPAADLAAQHPLDLGEKAIVLVAAEDTATLKPRLRGKIYGVTAFALDEKQPALQEFVKKYKERFQEAPDAEAGMAYDDARLLFEGIRKANVLEGPKIREALAEIRFDSLTGPVFFSPERGVVRAAYVVEWSDGQARVVKRFEAEEKVVSSPLAPGAAAR
jgi:branched-chain amino acid transport system substrate-binding protein